MFGFWGTNTELEKLMSNIVTIFGAINAIIDKNDIIVIANNKKTYKYTFIILLRIDIWQITNYIYIIIYKKIRDIFYDFSFLLQLYS